MVRATSISAYFPTILAASKHLLIEAKSAGRDGPRFGLGDVGLYCAAIAGLT
jgi:hypothetical protein